MRTKLLLGATVAAALVAIGCEKKSEPAKPAEAKPAPAAEVKAPAKPASDKARFVLFKPLRATFDDPALGSNDARVRLGQQLYFDARLSKSQQISCNSCHDLAKFGQDGEPTSPGHKGQRGGRNSPTTLNAAGHIKQFWDGRMDTVEEQAHGPVTNPGEMAMADGAAVEKVLTSIPEYVKAFAEAFPGDKKPVTFDNMANAIAAFERKLATPSRWDKFLGGDESALTDDEKKGFDVFYDKGCFSCHNGELVGGNSFQKLGAKVPYETADLGRFDKTKNEADKHFFKVPSLRNVAKTAPYFHDGKVKTLEEAIALMGKHQLGLELSKDEIASIATFLGALTGEIPAELAKAPELPKSTKSTPKADPN
jgi:cytochrome c peroxidase